MKLDELNQEIVACRKCPRLVEWREQVAREKRRAYKDWDYWGKAVPGFGDPRAHVLVVGLAPGAHGSNRTGRPFTGDASGGFLYPALYRAGFANQPDALRRDDGLKLKGIYITAVGRCAPPANKPTPAELDNCEPFLLRELDAIKPKVIVCLGRIAFDRILRILGNRDPQIIFGHGALYRLHAGAGSDYAWLDKGEHWLLCSYHPSRQNTQTGKLTTKMFDEVWRKARELMQHG
jgi:uracil-DNA glycosylase family 4